MAPAPLVLVDDGADMLAVQCGQNVLGMPQGVDDLKLLQALGVLEEGQDRPLDDEVVQIHGHQVGNRDAVDELELFDILGLLGIVAIQAALVLQVDERLGPDVLGQQKRPTVRAMRRDGAEFGRVLEEAVRGDARRDGQVALLAEHGQLLQMVAVADAHAAMLGQEHGQHLGVLGRDLVAEFGQHARGHAQIHADVIDVAGSGAAAGHEQNLELLLGLEQYVYDGEQRLGSAVHDGLAADLEHVHIGVHAEVFRRLGLGQELLADQGLAHEGGVDVQPAGFGFFLDERRTQCRLRGCV
ncbi:hypothetical protein DSECCO2_496780 [anaerobic digester metagenome]